jgi:GT2 family glycosyltransferase
MTDDPAVSVSIVLYNSAEGLGECLAALRPDVRDGHAEVIAVDNASPDASAATLGRELPEARLVRRTVNGGFAAGCNAAWPLARGRYWMLLNPDVVLPPGGLRRLVAWMDARPAIGLGSPELLEAEGRATGAARRFPSIPLALLELSRLYLMLPRRLRGRLFLGPYVEEGGELDGDWVPACAVLARREAVADAGLLSERFFMYGEDLEWCFRIKRAGWRVAVNGEVRALHRQATSALRTWGAVESRRRRLRGAYLACSEIRGPRYAWLHAAVTALALRVEAWHPGRDSEARRRAREDLSLHAELLRRGAGSPP